jgi:hypothetical protein
LAEAFQFPAIIKLDVVAYVQQSRFTDFSIIYILRNNGKPINNVNLSKEVENIKQDILYYSSSKNYFKALKRLFSLVRISEDLPLVEKLNVVLNSDLGRLYSITSDLGTLLYLLENESRLPTEKIRYELDQFRNRLGNIYTIDSVGKDSVLGKLISASGFPGTAQGRKKLFDTLTFLIERFEDTLSRTTLDYLKEVGLYPFPSKYLP